VINQWEAVDAFLAAARDGDFGALLAVLDPDAILRAHGGVALPSRELRGAAVVAGQALMWKTAGSDDARRALINGAAGLVIPRKGRPFSVGAITVRGGKIAEIDVLADPERLARLDLTVLENCGCRFIPATVNCSCEHGLRARPKHICRVDPAKGVSGPPDAPMFHRCGGPQRAAGWRSGALHYLALRFAANSAAAAPASRPLEKETSPRSPGAAT